MAKLIMVLFSYDVMMLMEELLKYGSDAVDFCGAGAGFV